MEFCIDSSISGYHTYTAYSFFGIKLPTDREFSNIVDCYA